MRVSRQMKVDGALGIARCIRRARRCEFPRRMKVDGASDARRDACVTTMRVSQTWPASACIAKRPQRQSGCEANPIGRRSTCPVGHEGIAGRCLNTCPNVNVQSHASTAQRRTRSHLVDLPARSFTQRRRAGAIPSRFPVVRVAMPCTKRTPDAMLLCTAPGAFIFGIPLTASRLPRTPSSRRHRATGSARRCRAMFPR